MEDDFLTNIQRLFKKIQALKLQIRKNLYGKKMQCLKENKLQDNTILSEFECPVCLEYMNKPILMCTEGHSLCKKCMSQISKCPICLRSKSDKRNYSLENLRAKMHFPCKYKSNNCEFIALGAEIANHEKNCVYRTFYCPFKYTDDACTWIGHKNDFFEHCQLKHKLNTFEMSGDELIFVAPKVDAHNIKTSLLRIVKFNNELFCIGTSFSMPSFYLNWYCYYVGTAEEAYNYSYQIKFEKGYNNINLTANCHYLDDEKPIFNNTFYLSCHCLQLFSFLDYEDIRYSFKLFAHKTKSTDNDDEEKHKFCFEGTDDDELINSGTCTIN